MIANTRNMRTGVATTTLAATMLLGVVPASDAAPATRFRAWRVSRTATTPARLDMTVVTTPTGPGTMTLITGVRLSGGRREARGTGAFYEAGDPEPVVFGLPSGQLRPCDTATCYVSSDVQELRISTEPTRDEYLVVTDNGTARVTLATPGWRVRALPSIAVRRLTASEAGGSGVTTPNGGVEMFSGTVAAAGKYGSVAWAFLPCDVAGTGSARFDAVPVGQSAALSCDGSGGPSHARLSAPGAAQWQVTGVASGVTERATRLVVVDLPRI